MIRAFIAGLAGPTLTDDERAFFAETRPWGFILFKRNIETPGAGAGADRRACATASGAPTRRS